MSVEMASNQSTLVPHFTRSTSEVGLDSLYPAIVECFTIILLGYITGRGGWINKTHAMGLNTFTTKFALPSLLFESMATLDWSKVEWTFIAAIFISKAALFFIVLTFCLLIKRPSNVGLAALTGIFVTQSNDFAMGYPIVKAIYGESQPQLLQYIYLLAPISLLILNPLGFVLLELHRASSDPSNRSRTKLLVKVVKEMISNPIIVMTALGVCANFIFSHKLPLILDNLLTTLSDAFGACALFIVGLGIVGKFNKTMTPLLMGSGMLIFVKLLLFPMVAMGITAALGCGQSTNSTSEYSMFAFLYGTFPTAPSVYIYATQYSVGVDLIATSLVLGTVISAPLMFISAMMVGMQIFPVNAQQVLSQTSFGVAVLALICCAAILLLFMVTKRCTRMPHVMVLLITLFQLMISLGNIIDTSDKSSTADPIEWWTYLKFILHCLGILGVSTMTSVTAITIYYMSCQSLCRALVIRPLLLFYGLGVPVLVVPVIAIIGLFHGSQVNKLIMFGNIQMAVVAAVLISNILLTILVLIFRQRRALVSSQTPTGETSALPCCPHPNQPLCAEANVENNVNASLLQPHNTVKRYGSCAASSSDSGSSELDDEKTTLLSQVNIEDIVPVPSTSALSGQGHPRICSPVHQCSPERVQRCQNLIESYERINEDNIYASHYQLGRVLVLLTVLLLCQIIVSLYYIWQLALPNMVSTSLSAEIEFIYIVLSTGQGFLTFLTFGLDSEIVLIPVKKFFIRCVLRRTVEANSSPSEKAQHICQQFTEHHLAHCRQSLPRLHSSKLDCFCGSALVSWLIEVGLAPDRSEGQIYSDWLLQGEVIRSCSRTDTSFYDTKRHIFRFSKELPTA